MKNIFKYHNDTYGFTTWLFIGTNEEMTQWLKKRFKFAGDKAVEENNSGEAFTLGDDNGVIAGHFIWMPEFEFTCDDYAVLVHETLHVAIQAMYDRNCIIIEGNQSESLNYLQEAIFTNLLKQLHKEYSKQEKEQAK